MRTIKILIVEDFVNTVKGAFELAALYKYNENMTFDVVSRSQDVNFEHIRDYGLAFVDIELGKASNEDGFAVIRRLLNSGLMPLNRVLILTGNTVIEEKLRAENIDPKIEIVKKPADYDDIASVLLRHVKLNSEDEYTIL